MKVGILTFHFVDNYGAVLQAYALQNTLIKRGIQVEIIDYRPDFIMNDYRLIPSDLIRCPRKILSYIVHYSYRKNQHKKFLIFMNEELKTSNKIIKSIHNLNPDKYDFFIAGSDQIWNKKITGGDSTYFLNFAGENQKKIAYAASIGNEIDIENEKFILSNIEEFTKISVREEEVAKYFYNKNKIFVTVVDPVFLIDKYAWIKFESKPENIPSKYVLVYDLEGKKDILNMAESKAKKLNCQLISVHPLNEYNNGYKNMSNIGPKEFIYLIHNAECIYTNSFHGLAFSIIFDKCMHIIDHSTGNSRLRNIIEAFKLKITDEEVYRETTAKIYYTGLNTKKIIETKVLKSLKFLFDSMNLDT